MKRIIRIIFFIFIFSFSCFGQEIDIENEIMLGYTECQSGQFGGALSHFEKVIDSINQSPIKEIPNEDLLSIYVISGICAKTVGKYNQSFDYLNMALALQNIPEEYLVTLLSNKLQICEILSLEDDCNETEMRLKHLYNLYKDLEIVHALTIYYLAHKRYEDILFEPDMSTFRIREDNELHSTSDRMAIENIFNALGKSYLELSFYDQALKYFFKALDYLAEYTERDKSMIYVLISNVYEKMRDWENSLKYQMLAIECE